MNITNSFMKVESALAVILLYVKKEQSFMKFPCTG